VTRRQRLAGMIPHGARSALPGRSKVRISSARFCVIDGAIGMLAFAFVPGSVPKSPG